MRKNSGITLITVMVTIVVLIIISGISITYINSTLIDLKESKYSSELANVKTAVRAWFSEYVQKDGLPSTTIFDFPTNSGDAIEEIIDSPCNDYTREELESRLATAELYELKNAQFKELQLDGMTPGAYYIFDINAGVVYGPMITK